MQICDQQQCNEIGLYPAPKSRDSLKNYFFFCLTHVRIYNKNWNYYKGMTTHQIDADRQADVIGHRPLWQQALRNSRRNETNQSTTTEYLKVKYDTKTIEALELLQVPHPICLDNIKTVYKNWVKKLHPDSHESMKCEISENKLKEINQAYTLLKLAFAKDSA